MQLRAITPIPAIQGSGSSAAMTGNVTTRGIVVGDYEGPSPTLRGFYLQAATGDGDAATSDGIFVFNGNANSVEPRRPRHRQRQRVRLPGPDAGLGDAGHGLRHGLGRDDRRDAARPVRDVPRALRGDARADATDAVRDRALPARPLRPGRDVVGRADRRSRPRVVAPGAAALALQAANNLNRLIVDDALQSQNPDPILFGRGGNPLTASNTLRGGDTATGMVGVLSYTWAGNSASGNAYRLRPVEALGGGVPSFVAANPRPSGSPTVGGPLKAVGMNLLNFFNSFGTTGCSFGVGGPVAECRGADDAGEFARQWPKTVEAIIGTGGDVIGIGEIENDGYGPTSAIQFLVDRLNEATAPGTYAFIDADAGTGQMNALGTDAIKVGLLYKPAKVTPIGADRGVELRRVRQRRRRGTAEPAGHCAGVHRPEHRRSCRRQREPPQEQGQCLRRAGHRRRPGQLRRGSHERREPARRLAERRSHRHRDRERPHRRRPELVREGESDRRARGQVVHEPDRVPHRLGRVLVRVRRAVGLPRLRAREPGDPVPA